MPWYYSPEVCSSHNRMISFKYNHILTHPCLSRSWHSPYHGLQGPAWSIFACSLTSPLSHSNTLFQPHWPPLNSWNPSASFLLPGFCRRYSFAWNMSCACVRARAHTQTHTHTLALMHLSYGWLLVQRASSRDSALEQAAGGHLASLFTSSASLGKLLHLFLTCNMGIIIIIVPNSPCWED